MKESRKPVSRIAYFDCFAGASGNMIVGALIDAGADARKLKACLKKLPLGKYRISVRKAKANFISGTKFSVAAPGGQHERNLRDILEVLAGSGLPVEVVKDCSRIFERLAVAEARVHGVKIDEVHFHEVGATDSIIDIVGAVYLLHELGVEGVYTSGFSLGAGLTRCSHGVLPVPAPATVELLKGIPVTSAGYDAELVTPTGASILSTLSRGYGGIPAMRIERSGYGVGDRKIGDLPNCLRVLIGVKEGSILRDGVDIIMTNLDDISPQVYDLLMERLYESGALEVYLQPVQMKKNRPGVLVTAIAPSRVTEDVAETFFKETGTLGVRIVRADRRKLPREVVKVDTGFGVVRVKVACGPDGRTIVHPEYDDVRRIAKREGLTFRKVHDLVMKSASSTNKKGEPRIG
ncbi:MAG: nickel pincer cofactor biosynthesis protein LarC [Candidatus Tritonobacter lacicola]|nr:nickel pincer cofactor biosynthesis protein LarC [Candidatus Tritonobacter lacicola]